MAAKSEKSMSSSSSCQKNASCQLDDMVTVKGSITVQKKNILDLTNAGADVVDDIGDVFGRKVTVQLISMELDPDKQTGIRSEEVAVSSWFLSKDGLTPSDIRYELAFQLDKSFGIPGAFTIRNHHQNEFYLKGVKLELPDGGVAHFTCNSWVYNASKYHNDRVFFSNQVYLPTDTPPGLKALREQELQNLRGDGTGERQEWERIYDYDVYNDLGNPDKSKDLLRPVLGGSKEFPYPRRCRTGREPAKSDPSSESMPPRMKNFYVPSEDKASREKQSAIYGETLKAAAHSLFPKLRQLFGSSFDSFDEVKKLYKEGIDVVTATDEDEHEDEPSPYTILKVLTDSKDGNSSWLKYPIPQVIAADEWAWSSDEEFARQTIAGVHPLLLHCMKAFPPESKLDPTKYGPQASSLTAEHIEDQLEGLSVQEALHGNKLFSLDYYDIFMPFASRINALEGIQAYASRSIFFLTKEGCLKPVAIELSLPPAHPSGPCKHRIFTPSASGGKDWLWELAKAHVSANDSVYHQVVSHWTQTHAVLEPFILAARRHLSVMHPVHLLLEPHFKNTVAMNAMARRTLTNAGGMIESSFSSGQYSFEMSSAAYNAWHFDEQGLPADLINRGMAVLDATEKHGLRLAVEDYPYAVDGLEIWDAIKSWVHDYISLFYKDDAALQADYELKRWWEEIRTVGHADKRHEQWTANVDTKDNFEHLLTTLIWTTSAHHAVVNYGQYAYEGFMPNHPSKTHRFIPEEGSKEHEELLKNPEKFFLTMVPTKAETATVMTTLEVLSTHPEEEEYLGERPTKHWTNNQEILAAFDAFASRMKEIEKGIEVRNSDPRLKNRRGPADVPYTLLYPHSKPGLTGKGIPNSVTI